MYEVPVSQASTGQNKFPFTIPGKDEKFSIKRMKFLKGSELERIENPESISVIYDMFGKVGTPLGDAIRDLDQDQFKALMEAWKADSGMSEGESEGSES